MNRSNHTSTYRKQARQMLLLAALPLLSAVGLAQDAANDETLSLEQFRVSADRAQGYRSANSITATGLGEKTSDVPISINVLTGQFVEDTHLDEMRDALKYVPGITTSNRSESSFNVRGFDGLISYRNGFYRRQTFPSWNIEQIEVVKGSSAVFFGTVRPGGLINYLTKKPVFGSNFTDVTVDVGSYDYYKGSVFTNQNLSKDVAVRLGVGHLDTDGFQDYYFKRETYAGGSATWKISPQQELTVDTEAVNRRWYNNNSHAYAITNSRFAGNASALASMDKSKSASVNLRSWLDANGYAGTPTYDTYAPIYGSSDPYGFSESDSPDNYQVYKTRTVDLVYLVKPTDSLVWRTGLNYSYDYAEGLRTLPADASGNNPVAYADGTIRMRFQLFKNIRDTYNLNNKLSYRFNVLGANNTFQLGQDLQRVLFRVPGFANGSFQDSLYSAYFFFNPLVDRPLGVPAIAANGQSFNVTRRRTEIVEGYYAMNQTTFYGDRVHLLYGARLNRYRGSERFAGATVSNATSEYEGSNQKWTPQLGGLYKVLPELGIFAVYSESIEPNYSATQAANPTKGKGYDLGVKSDLFGGRVAATATYYKIDQNKAVFNSSNVYLYDTLARAEGIELDASVTPFEHDQIVLGFNHYILAKNVTATDANVVGQPLPYTPENAFTLWNRYEFATGALKGLVWGAGLRYSDEARLNSSALNRTMVPSFVVYNLMFGYKLPVFGLPTRLQLNLNNVTNKHYREGADGMYSQPRTVYFSVSTRF